MLQRVFGCNDVTLVTFNFSPMLYMVIEHFKEAAVQEIYRRFREKGRMMPDGLKYLSSWIDTNMKVCYQLMETDDAALFSRWTENWDDLMDFEIVPVRTSAETSALVETLKS
jgi:Protein of unknown function (DUF3303)